MEYTEFYKVCKQTFACNAYLPQPNDLQIEKLYTLTNILVETNKVMNLTAIKDEKAIILRHYADSVAVSEYLPYGTKVIDVGCGAGFPTLPLAIFRPDLQITALDSTEKRIEYVAKTAANLNLDNVTAIAERAEVLGNTHKYRETFDCATARAVATLPILTELCLPFVKIGGVFVAMKAQKADDEVAAARNAITKCGGTLAGITSQTLVNLSNETENRTIVLISKTDKTPKELPRHYSKISKKPL